MSLISDSICCDILLKTRCQYEKHFSLAEVSFRLHKVLALGVKNSTSKSGIVRIKSIRMDNCIKNCHREDKSSALRSQIVFFC